MRRLRISWSSEDTEAIALIQGVVDNEDGIRWNKESR